MTATSWWYITTPSDDDNIGYGAEEMRKKWEAIQERMVVAHIWGVNNYQEDGEHIDDKIVSLGVVSGTINLDMSAGRIFQLELSGDVTIQVSTPTIPSGFVRKIWLLIKQGTTQYTVTFPSNFIWNNGNVTNVTSVAGRTTIYECITYDGGSNWVIIYGGDYDI